MALRNSFLYDRTRYYEPFFLATFSHLYINITRVLPSCFVFALYFSSRLAFEPQIRGQGLSPLSPLGTVPFFIAGRHHQHFLPSSCVELCVVYFAQRKKEKSPAGGLEVSREIGLSYCYFVVAKVNPFSTALPYVGTKHSNYK